MTATTAETLSANGVVLNTLARNIESITGRLNVPSLRTDNVMVPGRHGRLRVSAKFYDESNIVLPMWVRGCDDNGNVPASTRKQFYANIDTLTNIFQPGDGMIDLRHTLPDGSVRRVLAECTDVINFSVMGGNNPLGKFSVSLRVPSAFWEDVEPLQATISLPITGFLTFLNGLTAPVTDSVITIVGPAINTTIESESSGAVLENRSWFNYSGNIGAGQSLIVDCGKWTLTGTGGYVPNYGQFTHSSSTSWLTLVPGVNGAPPWIAFSASNTTAATKLIVQARRKYLVG